MLRKRFLLAFLTLLFSVCAFHSFAQTKEVTGTVTDDKTNQPVPNATVEVKGTTIATSTDSAGTFRLNVPSGATLLQVSSISYITQEVPINGNVINIMLSASAASLDNVVVIGYGTARKRDLTGAVTTISSEDFQKGNITTPEQQIAGKVAGVSIVSNGGRPGAGSTIRIRGGSSINASNDPLIVIDGVPLDNGNSNIGTDIKGASNPLSFINANDIESYTVLKDASAAAIYGSRANNGVIIITTKRGKSGKLRINFSTNNSLSKINNTVDVLSADEVRNIVNQYGTAKQISQLGTANTDWQKEIYQTGFGSDNNLSISGGIKNLPFRVTFGYLTQTGILKTDKLDRQSLSLAINPTLFDNHLKINLNLKGSTQQTRFASQDAVGSAVAFDPTQPVYMALQRYGGYFQWTEADSSLVLNRGNNPLGLLQQTFDKQKPMRSIGNLELDYKFHFLPELRANVNMAYDASSNTGNKYIPADAATDYLTGGAYTPSKQSRTNTVFDAYLNYAKDLTNIKSRVDATVGYSYNNFKTKNYNYLKLDANRDTIANSTPPTFPYDIPEYRLRSYFGRLLYNYDSRYFLTASLRRDGSSKFSSANRWGWFPSFGLAWSVKNDFFKEDNTLSELKLRFGYGKTGQQDGIGYYDYIARYGQGGLSAAYPLGDTYFQTYGPYGYNADLRWEKLKSYNVALDFGFLNNRISGSVDYYIRTSTDLLFSKLQSAGTNFSAYITANVGSLENKGIELNLNLIPVQTKDLEWNVNLNATYNKNKILNLTGVANDTSYVGLPTGSATGVNGFVQLQQVGSPRSSFYLYQQVYDAAGVPLEGVFVDKNGDGIINAQDKFLKHYPDGNYLFGFSTSLNYKSWNVGTVLRASLNNYLYNNVASNLGRRNAITGNYTIGNASSNYLATNFLGTNDLQTASDYYVENASFLRMDNFYLGYNFGKKLFRDKVGLRATASVQNVFVATKYSGLDPEVVGGIDNTIYPRPRIYNLSLNLDF